MPQRDVGSIDAHARTFSALGDITRLSLLHVLRAEPDQSISQLSTGLEITRQAVGKHLEVLEAAGIVGSRKKGRERQYRLRREALTEAEMHLRLVTGQWNDALQRLRNSIEK